jgi:prepilin-type N-terminal cleavage/methylation domain-containing protein
MRQLHNNQLIFLLKKNQGFTLIEILVALALITLVLGISISGPNSSRSSLDKDVNSLERSLRFMSDEAALKNAVVRLHFLLDREPQEYAVEYGPSDSFILPPEPIFETSTMSLEDIEKKKKETKDTNLKFNKVQEFQDNNFEMSDEIKIIGVGTTHSKKLLSTGEVSLYTYPTGEKDESLILIASDEDIISLKVNPFSLKIDRQTHPLGVLTDGDLSTHQQAKAKEIFEIWQKEK